MDIGSINADIASQFHNLYAKYQDNSQESIIMRLNTFCESYCKNIEYELRVEFQNETQLGASRVSHLLKERFNKIAQVHIKLEQEKMSDKDKKRKNDISNVRYRLEKFKSKALTGFEQYSHGMMMPPRRNSSIPSDYMMELSNIINQLQAIEVSYQENMLDSMKVFRSYELFLNNKVKQYISCIDEIKNTLKEENVKRKENIELHNDTEDMEYEAVLPLEEKRMDIDTIISKNSQLDEEYL